MGKENQAEKALKILAEKENLPKEVRESAKKKLKNINKPILK